MKYLIDFHGFVTINAGSEEEAERKFWAWISSNKYKEDCSNDEFFIYGIDESEED